MPRRDADDAMPPGPPLLRARYQVPIVVLFIGIDVAAVGLLPIPEHVTLTLRSAVAPGLGLIPDATVLACALFVSALVTTWSWFRWGIGLPALAAWWISIVLTLRLSPSPDHVHAAAVGTSVHHPLLAFHEFTWVMAVYVLVYWVGTLLRRLPLVDRLASRRERQRPADDTAIQSLPLVERARAIALWEIVRCAGGHAPERSFLVAALGRPERDRGLRVRSALAHGSPRDPLRRDNSHIRAAQLLLGKVDGTIARDAAEARLGMPPSEPGWVNLLDATLLAFALSPIDEKAGQRWAFALERWFRLRHGHRPDARHDFIGISRGRAPAWQHASALAIAADRGWIDRHAEWLALRPQVLAAIGRGGRRTDDNRLVAAGRCWAAMLDDAEARRLLQRVTSSPRDPIARALDSLSAAFQANTAESARSQLSVTTR